MKTSELTGAALDWAVAKCEEYPMDIWYDEDELPMVRDDEVPDWKPSTDWTQGGPIIEREGISWHCGNKSSWHAYGYGSAENFSGPTPLIAAMRCYVASNLGDDVQVPEELQP